MQRGHHDPTFRRTKVRKFGDILDIHEGIGGRGVESHLYKEDGGSIVDPGVRFEGLEEG